MTQTLSESKRLVMARGVRKPKDNAMMSKGSVTSTWYSMLVNKERITVG